MSNFNTSRRRSFALSWLLAAVLLGGVVGSVRAADDKKPDFNALQRQLRAAYQGANYEKALEIAGKMHALRPKDVNTLYNTACLHCLLGHKAEAYTWIEKAIDAGYRDADHMLDDADFKTIRGEDRFRRLVRRVRKLVAGGPVETEGKRAEPTEAQKKESPSPAKMSPQERFEKIGELTRKLIETSTAGMRKEALKIALEANKNATILLDQLRNNDRYRGGAKRQLSLTHYNVACMYSLLKKSDKAIEHLNKAIALGGFSGGNLAEQIKGDKDFDNIRKDPRYATLLKRAAERSHRARPRRRPAPGETKAAFKWKVTLPADFDRSTKAPLLVALHHYNGNMEKTTRRWKKAASKVGAILLTPQGTVQSGDDHYQWGRDLDLIEENVMDAINKVSDQYKVDEDKIVLAGFSQGGWVTWALAMRNPDTFCGIIPVAGLFRPESDSAFEDKDLAGLRVYIMVGGDDSSRTIDSNRQAAKRFKKIGAKVKLNVYEGVGHGFPEHATREEIKALRFVLGG